MSAIGTHLPIFSHQFYQIFIREVIGQNVGLRMASSSTRTDRQTDRQTDTVLESSYGNMSAHKKFQLKTKN